MKIALCIEPATAKRKTLQRVIANASAVERYLTGQSLYRSIKTKAWDMVIVGWTLGDMEGIELLRWIKASGPTPPLVVFVTENATDRNVISALEYGADDFIVEPATKDVVRARIETLARRAGRIPVPATVSFGQYLLDRRHQFIEVSGQRVTLRPKEYALVAVFFENFGHPLTREFLHSTIWGSAENIPSRTLDTHLSRLRARLREISNNAFEIVPVRGIGYKLIDTTEPGFDGGDNSSVLANRAAKNSSQSRE
jgi:DNA-binding response OmpR family regulator